MPVEEIRGGLWSIPVAIPLPGLSAVIVYAFEVPGGLVLVDAGWGAPESLASLQNGLGEIGACLGDVRGAVFTHAHGDHYGLAGQVRERSGAWIALHGSDRPLVVARLQDGKLERDFSAWLSCAGVSDPEEQATMFPGQGRFSWRFPAILPDVILSDGDRIDAPGWELDVRHVPGHTPGHIVLIERRLGVIVTGDTVLARITPNVSITPHSGADPLGDFLRSLDELACHLGFVGLAGHGHRVADVTTRAREIQSHHELQLRRTLEIVCLGAGSVREVGERMPWSRPWNALPGWERRAALGEAHAHLVALERRGLVELIAQRPWRWRAARGVTPSEAEGPQGGSGILQSETGTGNVE